MKPDMHPRETSVFAKPEGWDDALDGPCGKLSVHRVQDGRFSHYYSRWQPSPEDLALLAAGGQIELCCVGVQPPVAVSAVAKTENDRGATA